VTNGSQETEIADKIDELRGALGRKTRQLATISALANRVNATLDLDELLGIVLDGLHDELGFEHTMVLLLTPGSDELVLRAARGYEGGGIGAVVRIGKGPVGVAAKRRKILRMNNIRMRSRYVRAVAGRGGGDEAEIELPGLADVDSQIAIPLLVKDRGSGEERLIGVIAVESQRAGAFNALDQDLVGTIGNLAAAALDNARLHTEQAAIMHAYERFVPKQFLNFLQRARITEVSLGDQVQLSMSVLFSDIRSFTTLSEQMSPEENFAFLNAYLGHVAPAIRDNGGFIDKYIGDAIMALFPTTADDAVRGAVAMLVRVAAYNDERMAEGRAPIAIGVGIHTGNLMLGTVGFADRMEGTVISDSVNLAARVEGLTKRYGATVMITQDTLDRLADPSSYEIRYLDRVKVKGKTEPVAVYEVFEGDLAPVRAWKKATLATYARALNSYYERRFEEAAAGMAAVLERAPDDRVAATFKARAEALIGAQLEDDWDGVMKLDSK